MSGVNKAIIVGNLGGDPEMRQTQSGSAVANFTVATNRKYKGSDGQLQEETEWHRVVAFGRLAEICGQYLHKGKQVYIEGRIQTRKWQGKDGQDRWTTEIVANEMTMLGGRGGDSGGGSPDWGGSQEPVAAKGQAGGNMAAGQEDDDLPF